MVLVMVLLLAKQIITFYHAVQKTLTKDQHALVTKLGKTLARFCPEPLHLARLQLKMHHSEVEISP